MKSIYLDVLIVLNIYVNYFLLRATAKFTHTPLKTIRCIISSVIGSLFSSDPVQGAEEARLHRIPDRLHLHQ